jgi:hypothetical protein
MVPTKESGRAGEEGIEAGGWSGKHEEGVKAGGWWTHPYYAAGLTWD